MWDLWWTKWHWGRFSSSTSVSSANLHSTNFSTITITYHPHKLKKTKKQKSGQCPTKGWRAINTAYHHDFCCDNRIKLGKAELALDQTRFYVMNRTSTPLKVEYRKRYCILTRKNAEWNGVQIGISHAISRKE
jgi:hypothetical protein